MLLRSAFAFLLSTGASGFVERIKGKTVAAIALITRAASVSGLYYGSVLDGQTAHAGGGQANGVPITKQYTRFTIVATAGDSATLMPALLDPFGNGLQGVTVSNAAAVNAMNIFPAGTDQINALGAGVAFSLAAGKTVEFYSSVNGQWHALLSA